MAEEMNFSKDLAEIDKIISKLESNDYSEAELDGYYKYIQGKQNDLNVLKRVYQNKLDELLKDREDDEQIQQIKTILEDTKLPTAEKEARLKDINEQIQQSIADGLSSVKELRQSLTANQETQQ